MFCKYCYNLLRTREKSVQVLLPSFTDKSIVFSKRKIHPCMLSLFQRPRSNYNYRKVIDSMVTFYLFISSFTKYLRQQELEVLWFQVVESLVALWRHGSCDQYLRYPNRGHLTVNTVLRSQPFFSITFTPPLSGMNTFFASFIASFITEIKKSGRRADP